MRACVQKMGERTTFAGAAYADSSNPVFITHPSLFSKSSSATTVEGGNFCAVRHDRRGVNVVVVGRGHPVLPNPVLPISHK